MSRPGKFLTCILSLIATLPLAAQADNAVKQSESVFSNTVFNVMLAIIVLFLLIIIGMAEVVKAGGAQQLARAKKEKQDKNSNGPVAGLFLFFILAATTLHAASPSLENLPSVQTPFNYWGMGAQLFYLMLIIILFEVLIASMLFRSGMLLIRNSNAKQTLKKLKAEPSLLEKLNASVAVEEEESIMMDHDYDGIRELDNDLPPWWKYGFYLTIAVAVVYLFHFHVFHTGKLSIEEYNQQMKDGALEVAEYQKSAVNLVDENSVNWLTDEASISDGKKIYKENCVACHGEFGEGKEGLGPNFTDDYWLHGGSVKDVFRSVKYGWTDKGMKSWQQDLKPSEIQMVVSFLHSIRGTNPPNAREKQGELYLQDGAKPTADSAKPGTDSLPAPANEQVKNK